MLHICVSALCFTETGLFITQKFAGLLTGTHYDIGFVYLLYLTITAFCSAFLIGAIMISTRDRYDKVIFGVSLGGITLTHCAFIIIFAFLSESF